MATLPALPKAVPVGIPEELWQEASWLPCVLSVNLAVGDFTIGDLLCLEGGMVFETKNASSADVPVVVNSRRIGWAEFEVVGQRMGIRITELG
jgi:flagellar motor switch/type III secretory pathway protein FliN